MASADFSTVLTMRRRMISRFSTGNRGDLPG